MIAIAIIVLAIILVILLFRPRLKPRGGRAQQQDSGSPGFIPVPLPGDHDFIGYENDDPAGLDPGGGDFGGAGASGSWDSDGGGGSDGGDGGD